MNKMCAIKAENKKNAAKKNFSKIPCQFKAPNTVFGAADGRPALAFGKLSIQRVMSQSSVALANAGNFTKAETLV